MKFDFHTHHERCGHAFGCIEQYIQSAIDHDLDMIGISDHTPYFMSESDQLFPRISMAKSELVRYVQEVLQLKEKYKDKIEVLLGIESDFFPDYFSLYKNELNKYPFDYVIGSVHRMNQRSVFDKTYWEQLSPDEQLAEKERYYQFIQQSARTKYFDILGHIDVPKANFPSFSEIETPIIDETLQVIVDCDCAIEINTSGVTKCCGGYYPSFEILERACHYGVTVTFGSDSHDPNRVGEDFDSVKQLLREIGFKQWAIFRGRKRELVCL